MHRIYAPCFIIYSFFELDSATWCKLPRLRGGEKLLCCILCALKTELEQNKHDFLIVNVEKNPPIQEQNNRTYTLED